MLMLAKIILLFVLGLLGVLCMIFLRFHFGDSDAIEIELRQVERWDSETPSLESE